MTTNQPLSLFISSKMTELQEERYAVQKALAAYHMYGWLWEKDAGARPEPIQSTYLKEVEACDIYIGLFWKGYGEYTLEEYWHAHKHNKPCLVYEKQVDIEQRDPQLTDFLKKINRVSDGLTVCHFERSEELTEQVQKDIIQLLTSRFRNTRQQPIWNIPFARNPFFTGRDELLELLHTQLQTMRAAALSQPQAISGLGGIGKTQLAIEYAYRYRQEYQVVLWARADTTGALNASYTEIAGLLQLPQKEAQDQEVIVEAVKDWLRSKSGWLLILDNADDLNIVQSFLPTECLGHLLLTTRSQVTGKLAQRLEVDTLDRDVGAVLLLRRSGLMGVDAPLNAATEADQAVSLVLTENLGGLPLALDQAGTYIEETRCSLADYQRQYQTRRAELLARRGILVDDHPEPVATTWSLSFTKVERGNPTAAELLRACAFLAPDTIPEELLVEVLKIPLPSSKKPKKRKKRESSFYSIASISHQKPEIVSLTKNEGMIDEATAALRAYSLMKRNNKEKVVQIHRLIQAVQMDALKPEEQRQWAERVVRAVNVVFPHDPGKKIDTWPQCLRYLEQALICDTLIQRYMFDFIEASDLLDRTGIYLFEHASYTMVELLYQHALDIRERRLGPNDLRVATSLNNLAKLYKEQGKYEEAELLYQRTLVIRERQLGSDHPLVATSLNGLANLYKEQGKYAEAEPLYQRALAIREQQLEPDDVQIATSLNNLANLHQVRGRYTEAELLYQRALAIWEQQLGPEDPEVAHPLNNLASLYFSQTRYTEAERLYRRALAIWEQQKHPQVAYVLNNLGELYEAQGRYAEAEPLYQRALTIWEQQEPLMIAFPLTNLGSLYSRQNRYTEAEPLYQRALTIWEQQNHLLVAHPLDGLAALYFKQGRYVEAESLYQRALSIREQTLEPHHPDTAETLHGFAALRVAQGNLKEAVSLYQRALSIREYVYGSQHPKTIDTRERLRVIYDQD